MHFVNSSGAVSGGVILFNAVLTLYRRVTRDGMVSVGGNLYSVPDCTRRRVVEVHTLASEIHILEDDKLLAVHPVLEGRGQRRIAGGHRTAPPPANSTTARETPRQSMPDRNRRPPALAGLL